MTGNEEIKKKQSVIVGGLISSAGLFFAKFIGLFYAIPYHSLVQSVSNEAMYSVAFNIYSYVLNICTAGFPFAIAVMVTKYVSRGDYATSLLVKKLSFRLMVGLGFLAMLFLISLAAPITPLLLDKDITDPNAMRNVLIIISFALFFVPILSSLRGFYQGLKEMELYALSQVLEQLVRVIFLLSASAIAIYVFQSDRIWAVYFGVLSTSVAAIFAIIHIRLYDRKQMVKYKQLAKQQTVHSNRNQKVIVKELIMISFPYLLVAIFGYSDTIINSFFVKSGLNAHYLRFEEVLSIETKATILRITNDINFGVLKLMSIPMVLAPGFSSAILPHLTAALAKKDMKMIRKNIRDSVDIVLYIGTPLCFCLFAFAKPIYACLFPPVAMEGMDVATSLDLSANILRWFSIEAFLSTLAPIFTSMMMAAELRRENIRNLIIIVLIKFTVTYPLLVWVGYPALVLSSMLALGLFIYLDASALKRNFQIKWSYTFRKVVAILVGLVGIYLVALFFSFIGMSGYESSRLVNFIQLGISGLVAIVVYVCITYQFGLPQKLLHFDIKKWKRGKHA